MTSLDLGGGVRPGVDDLVVALAVGDDAACGTGSSICVDVLRCASSMISSFSGGMHDVVDAHRDAARGRVLEARGP